MKSTQAGTSSGQFRVFVGGLAFDITNSSLRETFLEFGGVKKALVIRDQHSGLSKGYGFVTFYKKEDLLKALATEVYIQGRKADCHPVMTKGALKEQEQRDYSNKLFVGGLSQSTTSEDIQNFFEKKFGKIKESRILFDGQSGKSRGFGFILFEDPSSSAQVLKCSNLKIKGKKIEVRRFSKEKDSDSEDCPTMPTQGSLEGSSKCAEEYDEENTPIKVPHDNHSQETGKQTAKKINKKKNKNKKKALNQCRTQQDIPPNQPQTASHTLIMKDPRSATQGYLSQVQAQGGYSMSYRSQQVQPVSQPQNPVHFSMKNFFAQEDQYASPMQLSPPREVANYPIGCGGYSSAYSPAYSRPSPHLDHVQRIQPRPSTSGQGSGHWAPHYGNQEWHPTDAYALSCREVVGSSIPPQYHSDYTNY